MILEEILIDMGLDRYEAKIYLALLDLGRARLSDIARKVGTNHVNTLYKLRGLEKKWLAFRVEIGKQKYYQVNNPWHGLRVFLQKQVDEVHRKSTLMQECMEGFMIQYKALSERPEVKFYEGSEAAKGLQTEIQNTKFDELLEFTNLDAAWKAVPLAKRRLHKREFKKAKRYARSIYTSEKGRILPRKHKRTLNFYIPSSKFLFEGEISIFGDKVALMSFGAEEQFSVVVRNKNIAQTMKSLFELAIEGSSKYQRKKKVSRTILRARVEPGHSLGPEAIVDHDSP